MIERHFIRRFRQLLRNFPIVCILGARQCGKTTFVKSVLPRWQYLDLEKPSDYARVSADPEDALVRLAKHFILDEAQQLPELFPVLRSFVDQQRGQNGQLVMLGSASPALIKQISESLAGRAGFLDLTPFLWPEVYKKIKRLTLEMFWLRGGFPQACQNPSDASRFDWFEAYTRTFIERDLSALGISISPQQMRKLWTMLAHNNGNIWNASQLAASMGVSYHTINRYTDILEQTFLLRKLQPYFVNIGKRLMKSPKIYFRDTGLLHFFLGISDPKTLVVYPSRGASWEGFVIEQIVNAFELFSPGSQAFYWRTAGGVEVDLLMVKGNKITPIEIKLHSAPTKKDAGGLIACMQDLELKTGYILYPGRNDYSLGHGITVLSVENLLLNPKLIKKL